MAIERSKEYELQDIRKRLWLALQQFYLYDKYLLKHDLMECAISHRLAVYLERLFPSWRIDCEYNRDGDDPKLADNFNESKRPDIIVHRRGKAGPNLLAVEIKKRGIIDNSDRHKAKQYIRELNYKWAVCISLGRDAAICEWHEDNPPKQKIQKLKWAEIEERLTGPE